MNPDSRNNSLNKETPRSTWQRNTSKNQRKKERRMDEYMKCLKKKKKKKRERNKQGVDYLKRKKSSQDEAIDPNSSHHKISWKCPPPTTKPNKQN